MSAEARCPVCHRLLFRWSPREYGAGTTVNMASNEVEVRCSRCRSTITFAVPGGEVVRSLPGKPSSAQSSAPALAS